MSKTILVQNGSISEGKNLIRKLLSENNLLNNDIKNKVICVDTPDSIYELEEFLGLDEFVFLAKSQETGVSINQPIDAVFIIGKMDNKADDKD